MVVVMRGPGCSSDRDPISNFIRRNWREKIKGLCVAVFLLVIIGGYSQVYWVEGLT